MQTRTSRQPTPEDSHEQTLASTGLHDARTTGRHTTVPRPPHMADALPHPQDTPSTLRIEMSIPALVPYPGPYLRNSFLPCAIGFFCLAIYVMVLPFATLTYAHLPADSRLAAALAYGLLALTWILPLTVGYRRSRRNHQIARALTAPLRP